jgi:hypothetical protein
MATNNILGFCTGAKPNVLTTTPARSSGFVSGIALSSHVNTAVVGGANIAHAVGEFIKNQLNEDVNPTNETALVSQFLRALQIFIQRGGACPIGSIIPYLGGDVPYGWLLANGASVLRTQYDKLFALIGTKFGAADEAHFNLPNLHHRFIEGTTTLSEVGSYIAAGLPNIRGTTQTFASADGSFRLNQTTFSHVLETDSTVNPAVSQITFDPSFVSSLYVNGLTEVRVNALFGLNLIKAF